MGKVKGNNKVKELSRNTEMIYPLPEMPLTEKKIMESCSEQTSTKLRHGFLSKYIHVLLNFLWTIAVTSCKCKRSWRVLKRLNIYLRASTAQYRLSEKHWCTLTGMKLIMTLANHDIEANHVLKIFCKRDRELKFKNICESNIS